MRFYALILVLICHPFFSSSAEKLCPFNGEGFYFSNGMRTSRVSAEATKDEFKLRTKTRFRFYEIAYNENEGLLVQLLEVLEQKEASSEVHFWKWITRLEEAPKWFRDLAEQIVARHYETLVKKDEDLRKQVATYREYLNLGYRQTLLAHSQGNFYANAALSIVGDFEDAKKFFRMIAVASPDSSVWGDGAEITESEDFIRHIQFSTERPYFNENPKHRGHSIREHYLAGNETSKAILDEINEGWTSAPIDVLKSGYLDGSFENFTRWLNKYILNGTKIKTTSLTVAQCLAINFVVYQSYWFGQNCTEKSVDAVEKYFLDDIKYWTTTFGLHTTPLFNMNATDPKAFLNASYFTVFDSRPECALTADNQVKVITPENIRAAAEFMRHPDFSILVE